MSDFSIGISEQAGGGFRVPSATGGISMPTTASGGEAIGKLFEGVAEGAMGIYKMVKTNEAEQAKAELAKEITTTFSNANVAMESGYASPRYTQSFLRNFIQQKKEQYPGHLEFIDQVYSSNLKGGVGQTIEEEASAAKAAAERQRLDDEDLIQKGFAPINASDSDLEKGRMLRSRYNQSILALDMQKKQLDATKTGMEIDKLRVEREYQKAGRSVLVDGMPMIQNKMMDVINDFQSGKIDQVSAIGKIRAMGVDMQGRLSSLPSGAVTSEDRNFAVRTLQSQSDFAEGVITGKMKGDVLKTVFEAQTNMSRAEIANNNPNYTGLAALNADFGSNPALAPFMLEPLSRMGLNLMSKSPTPLDPEHISDSPKVVKGFMSKAPKAESTQQMVNGYLTGVRRIGPESSAREIASVVNTVGSQEFTQGIKGGVKINPEEARAVGAIIVNHFDRTLLPSLRENIVESDVYNYQLAGTKTSKRGTASSIELSTEGGSFTFRLKEGDYDRATRSGIMSQVSQLNRREAVILNTTATAMANLTGKEPSAVVKELEPKIRSYVFGETDVAPIEEPTVE